MQQTAQLVARHGSTVELLWFRAWNRLRSRILAFLDLWSWWFRLWLIFNRSIFAEFDNYWVKVHCLEHVVHYLGWRFRTYEKKCLQCAPSMIPMNTRIVRKEGEREGVVEEGTRLPTTPSPDQNRTGLSAVISSLPPSRPGVHSKVCSWQGDREIDSLRCHRMRRLSWPLI